MRDGLGAMVENEAGRDRLAGVLRPVRAGNGFEEALEQILQTIRLGLVRHGERLPPERELAGRMGVSRVTLREALKVLVERGLVVSRRGRYGGTFVHAPEPPAEGARLEAEVAEVEDALRFRDVLESGAAELCASQGLSDAPAQRLRTAMEAAGDAEPADYRRQDTLFHLTLVELADSPSLTVQYTAVRARINELLVRIPLLVRTLEHSQAQHAELTEAVLAGEPERARRAAREHCQGTAALLRGFLA